MKLFFRKYGQGKPLIILHGLFGMSDNWVSIAKSLSDKYEVFLPDFRDHGQSPHDKELNYNIMSDDLLEFMQQQSITLPDIIGHSMGGKVAMNFAINHPDMLDKLIVVDIHPTAYTEHYEHLDLIRSMQSIDLSSVHSFSEIDNSLSLHPMTVRVRQFLLKNITKRSDNTFAWKFNLEYIKLNLHRLLEGIGADSHYVKPVLFIKGGLSNYIKDPDIADIKLIFPASVIKTIPQASHWVHADAPEEFLQIVIDFLK